MTVRGQRNLVSAETATVTVTIAEGASLSDEVDLEGYTLIGIMMPSAWTEAWLTFQAATAQGGTFQDVYDGGADEAFVAVAAGQAIGIRVGEVAQALSVWRYIKVRSGTSGTPVAQAAARTITLVLKA